MNNMLQLFKAGDVLHGFCNGFFGRDDYATKVCICVAPQYALFEYEEGGATVLNFRDGIELTKEMVDKWKKEEIYD